MSQSRDITVRTTTVEEILPWRDLRRQELNCQIVCDSLDSRKGWTQPYFLLVNEAIAGYGSVAIGGPWVGKPTVIAFYVLPQFRSRVFDLFSELLVASSAMQIESQTNDTLLSVMLHVYAEEFQIEAILFHDKLLTTHSLPGATLRPKESGDADQILAQQLDPEAEWVVVVDSTIAATGGILFHYNRPYGDIYMGVAEAFRRRGLGSYLVQELKRICYERGNIPAARCNATNIASRKTLQKAGFVPCGLILVGSVCPVLPTP
jgi:GNAT superfamily N-acetyltransferase